jgi:hypothetical protein
VNWASVLEVPDKRAVSPTFPFLFTSCMKGGGVSLLIFRFSFGDGSMRFVQMFTKSINNKCLLLLGDTNIAL